MVSGNKLQLQEYLNLNRIIFDFFVYKVKVKLAIFQLFVVIIHIYFFIQQVHIQRGLPYIQIRQVGFQRNVKVLIHVILIIVSKGGWHFQENVLSCDVQLQNVSVSQTFQIKDNHSVDFRSGLNIFLKIKKLISDIEDVLFILDAIFGLKTLLIPPSQEVIVYMYIIII